jgi:hypothetical protein
MMSWLTNILLLLVALEIAAHASIEPAHPVVSEDEAASEPSGPKCPELRGTYSCKKAFMLSYPGKKRRPEMKVVQSNRGGTSLFLFETSDGTDGFWAVGDGNPHAFDSESAAGWGFKSIDTEASCPKPDSLEIRYLVQSGRKKAPTRAGLLTFVERRPGTIQVSARLFPSGAKKKSQVEITTCERIDED